MVLSLNINQLFEFLLSLLQLIGDFDGVPLDFVLQVLVLLEKRLFYPFLLHRLQFRRVFLDFCEIRLNLLLNVHVSGR